MCDGSFSLATELWTTGFVVRPESLQGSWMMLPQLSEGRLCLAGSRTVLTGYHRRNCGFCPGLPFRKKKSCVKETWEGVSFSTDARTVCCCTLEARIYNSGYLTLWHHQRACCVGLPGWSVGFEPLQQLNMSLKAPLNKAPVVLHQFKHKPQMQMLLYHFITKITNKLKVLAFVGPCVVFVKSIPPFRWGAFQFVSVRVKLCCEQPISVKTSAWGCRQTPGTS